MPVKDASIAVAEIPVPALTPRAAMSIAATRKTTTRKATASRLVRIGIMGLILGPELLAWHHPAQTSRRAAGIWPNELATDVLG